MKVVFFAIDGTLTSTKNGKAAEELGGGLDESWMIGDRPEDEECVFISGSEFYSGLCVATMSRALKAAYAARSSSISGVGFTDIYWYGEGDALTVIKYPQYQLPVNPHE